MGNSFHNEVFAELKLGPDVNIGDWAVLFCLKTETLFSILEVISLAFDTLLLLLC